MKYVLNNTTLVTGSLTSEAQLQLHHQEAALATSCLTSSEYVLNKLIITISFFHFLIDLFSIYFLFSFSSTIIHTYNQP